MATKILSTSDFDQMDKRYRAKFINCLSGVKSANLLGTIDESGQSNLSIVSSCVHLGASPSLMGMVIRPRSVPRHSFDNLMESGFWTINHVNDSIIKQSHQTSARYPKETSEFEACSLTEEFIDDFKAPFVKESQLKLGLKLVEVLPIKHNDTEFVIGEIVKVILNDEWIAEDGAIDITQAKTTGVSGLDQYVSLQSQFRLSYAKPDKEVEEI